MTLIRRFFSVALAASLATMAFAQEGKLNIATVDMQELFKQYYRTNEAQKQINVERARINKDNNERLARIRENVLDWEHLPALHASSFGACELVDEDADGWRVRLTAAGGGQAAIACKRAGAALVDAEARTRCWHGACARCERVDPDRSARDHDESACRCARRALRNRRGV